MSIEVYPSKRPASLLAQDNVLPVMWQWRCEGLRTALVTLVGIEGSSPRPLGAQMVVAEDGRYFGYLSGGCLERSIATEAQEVIRSGENRLVRYGRGSKYIDVRLPCNSGLDFYFDCTMDPEVLSASVLHLNARRQFSLETEFSTGVSTIGMTDECNQAGCVRYDNRFSRVFLPQPRLLLLGTGPALSGLAALARAMGLDTEVWTPDESTRNQVKDAGLDAIDARELPERTVERLDASSAVVLVFHDHELEPELLTRILKRNCFYIGALGSRTAHDARIQALVERGLEADDVARVRGPVGTIQGAKSKASLAIGILAEVMAEAKERRLIA